jgi:hypothetical protein
MTGQALRRVLSVTAVTALASSGISWWPTAALVALGLAGYICRVVLQYRLAAKALDKAPPCHIAEIMTAIAGHQPAPASPRPACYSHGK